MMSFIWIKVTNDEYELPLAVADSAEKLARLVGVKAATIYSAAWQQRKGIHQRSIYQCVEVEDDNHRI